ncbi:MAG: hypothetical protein NVS3B23_02100 [Candidatus Saccharimonadales bacterium]
MIKVSKNLLNTKLGYFLRIGTHILRLPKYITYFENQITNLNVSSQSLDQCNKLLDKNISEIKQTVTNNIENLSTHQEKYLYRIDDQISDIKHQLLNINVNDSPSKAQLSQSNNLTDDANNDKFYKLFEDKFRGSEALIEERLRVYDPYFEAVSDDIKKLPIIDIGCGRGEMLRVLKTLGFSSIGIDMNKAMVDRAVENGFRAECREALEYLMEQKSNSFAAITGFHIVEHIPFGNLLRLFQECYRTIQRGGFVLFETPNPKNITVGSCNFYADPSHLHPLLPEVLAFALETQGFQSEIIYLHPSKEEKIYKNEVINDVARLIYGPQDYAILARKI